MTACPWKGSPPKRRLRATGGSKVGDDGDGNRLPQFHPCCGPLPAMSAERTVLDAAAALVSSEKAA